MSAKPGGKRREVEGQSPEQTYRFRMEIVRTIRVTLWILASSLPLFVMYLLFKEAAGKETSVNFGLNASVHLAGVAAAIWALVGRRKLRKQGEELGRLRERARVLEQQLEATRERPLSREVKR